MRLLNRKVFIVLIFLLVSVPQQAYPQLFFTKGYVVLASGDTVSGDIRERSNQLLELRTKMNDSVRRYIPEQLIGYQSEGVNHLAVHLSEGNRQTTYFMREQIKGYVSLYSLFKPEDRLTYAIRLPDRTFVPLRGNLTLLMLTTYLTDCSDPAFTRLLKAQASYVSNSQIVRIISAYNECVSPSESVKKPKKPFHYEAGVLAGVVKNNWEYTDEDTKNIMYWNPNGIYSSTYTATAGGFFTIVPRKRLSVTIEALFTHCNGTRLIYINNPLDFTGTDKRNRLYSFSESYFAVPLTARYVFIDRATRWYLKGGFVPTFGVQLKGSYSDDYVAPTAYEVAIPMRAGLGIGYLAGLGADIKVSAKKHLYIEARTMPHLVLYSVTHVANSHSLQLTISMPLITH